jgi:hypothetical protein
VQFPAGDSANYSDERRTSGNRPRDSLPVFLTVDEAAALLRTTPRAIYAMIARWQLPGVTRIRTGYGASTQLLTKEDGTWKVSGASGHWIE